MNEKILALPAQGAASAAGTRSARLQVLDVIYGHLRNISNVMAESPEVDDLQDDFARFQDNVMAAIAEEFHRVNFDHQ